MSPSDSVFTIGHSSQTIEQFIGLLVMHGIEAVADVRSTPYSRFAPQFSMDALKASLTDAKIAYVHLGKELGARSKDKSCYVDGRISFEKLAETDLFKQGIQRLLDGRKKYRISLMCAERDPAECHRTLLVSRALARQQVPVTHILHNGELEPHDETMLRILDLLKIPRNDLILSQQELINQAYVARANQFSSRKKS